MSETDRVFAGSIPEVYDTFLVPLIFEGYAADMATRVVAGQPRDVLETAAGSGAVTRALAPRLAADARYTVTDLNRQMLDRAAARQGPDHRVTWQTADALARIEAAIAAMPGTEMRLHRFGDGARDSGSLAMTAALCLS